MWLSTIHKSQNVVNYNLIKWADHHIYPSKLFLKVVDELIWNSKRGESPYVQLQKWLITTNELKVHLLSHMEFQKWLLNTYVN